MNNQKPYYQEYGLMPSIFVFLFGTLLSGFIWAQITKTYQQSQLDLGYIITLIIINVLLFIIQRLASHYLADSYFRFIILPLALLLALFIAATTFAMLLFFEIVSM